MKSMRRGFRNSYRNKGRAALVTLLLGVSVGIVITMLQVSSAVSSSADELKENLQTLIEVRAAGATAMGRGVEPLEESVADQVRQVSGIRSVEKYLYVRKVDNSKKFPVSVIAGIEPITSELRVNSHGEVGTPRITRGRGFGPGGEDGSGALVGEVYAEQNGLDIGSTFALGGFPLEVIGIFDSGFVFGNNQVFVPLKVAQGLAYEDEEIPSLDRISQVFVTARSVDEVDRVEKALRNQLGDSVDVLSGQKNAFLASEGLSSIQSSSFIGALLALVVAGLVVFFTMVLVTRERTREIGLLKALGASNGNVARQFVAESLTLALVGGLLGLAIFAAAAPVIADRVLGLSSTSLTGLAGGMGAQAVSDVITLSLSWEDAGYAILAALILGVLGSLYPVYRALAVTPAEALRYE
jgi:putative ABC transport system permease protein